MREFAHRAQRNAPAHPQREKVAAPRAPCLAPRYRIREIFMRWEDGIYFHAKLIGVLRVLLTIALYSHWVGCVWCFIGFNMPSEALNLTSAGLTCYKWSGGSGSGHGTGWPKS